MIKTAKISNDGMYRYSLTRDWEKGQGGTLWVMLNPSTADDKIDDPTIRRCIGFSQAWGRKSLTVVNLFAYRATDPKELGAAEDPIGPENDEVLMLASLDPNIKEIVVAWGVKGRMDNRDIEVHLLLSDTGKSVYCLGKTKEGHPRHPLYLPKTVNKTFWSPTVEL